ncbi:cytosolic protein [Peribacillus deserti]|uniref:Cytosolic protein n=1 Tax=Peribacillus deserti TaxID=673318 RepID=A0A2N5M7H2_9BACI|nr:cytosolic protein [Peribacillus deserti]PLT30306.1 cytosolic protein [Peribacillus deserti]
MDNEYHDFANVEKSRTYLTAEEFPEGAYGSPIKENSPVENKSTPWRPGQQFYTSSSYENKTLHEGMQRQIEPSHPTNDDPKQHEEPPYTNTGNS